MSMAVQTVPLFPLNTVLFPGGWLPLRIFEPRYLDMVSWCLRNDQPFGVCLIRSGSEVGNTAATYPVGTLAKIIDWNRRNDGLLGIVAEGQQRFRLLDHRSRANHLIEGDVSVIPADRPQALAAQFNGLVTMLRQVFAQIGKPYTLLEFEADNATWISNRLAELLPMGNHQRQHLLELEDSHERLLCLGEVLRGLDIQY